MTARPRPLTVLLVLAALAVHAGAAEYFVARDGSDANDGASRKSAFRTLQRGVEALKPGDTLTIAPGEYSGGVRRDGLGGAAAATTIRAEVPGTVVLRGDAPAPPFRKLKGYRFVYVADFDFDGSAQVVNELDTLSILEGVPSIRQLEFVPGRFHHDREARKLYVSTPDLTRPQAHRYTVSVTGTHGIYLSKARRVVIEGLAVTGFNTGKMIDRRDRTLNACWGIFLLNCNDCVVRNCLAYMNGQGIAINSYVEGTGDNAIERCRAWANGSQFGHGDRGGLTLHGRRRGTRDVIRDSVSFLNRGYGVNIYATGGRKAVDRVNRDRMIRNLAWGNHCDFKIKTGHAYGHTAERCVGPGLWSLNDPRGCLMGIHKRRYTRDNVALNDEEDLDMGREFADPGNHDYRLQSTSRFRGKGPGGADRGPLPYRGNVLYVSPKGNDAADGLSVSGAWRNLARALKALGPGQTLYLLPGSYQAGMEWRPAAGKGEPLSIRGRGHGRVAILGDLKVRNAVATVFERVSFSDLVRVEGGRDVAFKNCVFGGKRDGLVASSVRGLHVTHCFFAQSPLRIEKTDGVLLSGNIFGRREGPGVVLDGRSNVRYSDYNSYTRSASAWSVDGRAWSFDRLQRRHGRYSILATPGLRRSQGGFQVANRTVFGGRGPHGARLGVHSFTGKEEKALRLAGPFVHSVTDTTANLEWWASGPTRHHLAWGEAPKTDKTLTIDAHRAGSFSLTGLKPATRYSFRVALDRPARRLSRDGAEGEAVGGFTITFTTATAPQRPTVYYVALDGDDRDSGLNRDKAWRTVSRAADRARPGDLVLIAGGTYTGPVRLRATGERGRPITFKAMPGEKVTFDGMARTLSYAFLVTNKRYLNFDGFYFVGLKHFSDEAPWSDWTRGNNGAFIIYRSDNVSVTRCFHDGRGQSYSPGLIIAMHSRNTLVRNCVIAASMGGGISFAGCPDFRIENNVFLRNLISNLSEAMNEPHQKFFLTKNVITDNLRVKTHQPFFAIGKIESMVESANCYFLRIPDKKKRMFLFYGTFAYDRAAKAYRVGTEFSQPPVIKKLTRMSLEEYQRRFDPLSGSAVADPRFRATLGMQRTDAKGRKVYVVDRLAAKKDLDFPDLFVTHPELVKRGVGLRPEAFRDFHFSRRRKRRDR